MSSAFDRVVASGDPAMVVVTARRGDERDGCLVGFHSQSSIDPPRYCVWMSRANRTTRLVVEADHLAVHFLTASQRGLAATFGTLTGDEVDKFARAAWRDHRSGPPVLDDCAHVVVARVIGIDDVDGDHLCVTVEPVDTMSSGPFEPLRLSAVTDPTPGHEP